MKTGIDQIDIRFAECGAAGEKAQHLLKRWYRSNGVISDPNLFEGVAPYIVRLSGDIPADDSPKILFVGKKSLLGKEIKRSRSKDCDSRQFFRPEYRLSVQKSYRDAQEAPTLHVVQDVFQPDTGTSVLTYERITLPWRTLSGSLYLITYSNLVNKRLLTLQSNPARHFYYSRPRPNRILSLPAACPNEAHLSKFAQIHKQVGNALTNHVDLPSSSANLGST